MDILCFLHDILAPLVQSCGAFNVYSNKSNHFACGQIYDLNSLWAMHSHACQEQGLPLSSKSACGCFAGVALEQDFLCRQDTRRHAYVCTMIASF